MVKSWKKWQRTGVWGKPLRKPPLSWASKGSDRESERESFHLFRLIKWRTQYALLETGSGLDTLSKTVFNIEPCKRSEKQGKTKECIDTERYDEDLNRSIRQKRPRKTHCPWFMLLKEGELSVDRIKRSITFIMARFHTSVGINETVSRTLWLWPRATNLFQAGQICDWTGIASLKEGKKKPWAGELDVIKFALPAKATQPWVLICGLYSTQVAGSLWSSNAVFNGDRSRNSRSVHIFLSRTQEGFFPNCCVMLLCKLHLVCSQVPSYSCDTVLRELWGHVLNWFISRWSVPAHI